VHLPEKLLESLQEIKGFDKEAFEKVHQSGEQVTSIRINPLKLSGSPKILPLGEDFGAAVPWTEFGYYLNQRPSFTFDPLFHAGCYYVQEASSMFLEQVLKQAIDLSKPLKVLDLSAAPGGKSTHIQSLISKDSLLVSNDVIRSRANILKDNIIKWGSDNVVVTNNDPKDFARLENYFDVIVVDAPCSGSGLFRRDEEAIHEWSQNNVKLCSQRQQRILADAWPALKKEGILIYSTCSYSKEEDEDILDWMRKELSIVNCQLSIGPRWGITEVQSDSGVYGYRFWPDKVKGEGFFIACFQKKDGEKAVNFKTRNKFEILNRKEKEIAGNWTKETDHQFVKFNNTVYAVPGILPGEINILANSLHIIYFGTMIGELIREKLIPGHALALSNLISGNIERIELNYDDAIAYLQRKELRSALVKNKGWQLVTYQGYPLGWVNVLPNRINNYYPKELRILKDI
jgi:16S rRNA C967 or C1407 C5-methylase (RsmB/RsmF family)/NOL1/NOP2/fmu family ribosome biogenesis protein